MPRRPRAALGEPLAAPGVLRGGCDGPEPPLALPFRLLGLRRSSRAAGVALLPPNPPGTRLGASWGRRGPDQASWRQALGMGRGSRGGSVPCRTPRGGDGAGTGAAAGAGVAIWKVLHQTVLCLVRERRESKEIARLWLSEAGLRTVMWGLCGPQDILGGALLVLLSTPCCWLFVRTSSRGKRSANSRSSCRASGWRVAPPRK